MQASFYWLQHYKIYCLVKESIIDNNLLSIQEDSIRSYEGNMMVYVMATSYIPRQQNVF